MIRACRLGDGRYRLEFPASTGMLPWMEELQRDGLWLHLARGGSVASETVDRLNEAERVFGVITGPSSCGCEPAMFRWAGEREVAAGRARMNSCPELVDIIEVCGEADVARAVYEQEFASKVGAIA